MLKALPGILGTSGGDTTAPTITSSSSFTVNEGQDFETTLTAEETVTWFMAGGADQARFSLVGSTLSMAARNFESPQDADDDNRYEVTVRATDADGNFSEQAITVTVLDVMEGGGSDPDRVAGTEYTPDYVTNWLGPWLDSSGNIRVPATLSAGIADGRIPADALDYSTGNGGGAFPSYDAWVAAMLAQDKPGALGVDIAPSTMTASYLARGIYGYGSRMPKITFPTRTTARWNLYKYDLTFRGIEFVNYGTALRGSRPLVPLTIGGVVTQHPYHYTSTGDSWPHFGNATVNNMFRRVAIFTSVSDAGTISQIYIKRRPVNGTNPTGGSTWTTWNAVFEGGPDNFPELLGGSVSDANPTTLAQAINDYTATSGFTAEAVGSDVLLFNANAYKEALYFDIDCTGTLEFECCGPGVDISCCKFTDGNCFFGSFLDTIAFGHVRIMKNVGLGSWGLSILNVMRKSFIQVACNEWSDARSSRPAATGRTNSRMPSGSNTTQYNTIIFNGNNTVTMNVFGYSQEWYENNNFHDCESINNTDTNNCVVGFDLRLNATDFWLDGTTGGSFSCSWNKLVNLVGTQGAEDCNAIYAKPRGGSFSNNYIENCGAAWKSDGAFDGSECGGILIKEGRVNFGMPQLLVERNSFVNMPHGIPMCKVDNQYNHIIRYNYFKNWRNAKNGVTQVDGSHAGALRVTGFIAFSHVHSNFMENVNTLGQPLGISYHNVTPQGTAANNDLAIHNNVFQNDGSTDYPEYTGNTTVMRFNIGNNPPANVTTFFNTAVMGYNLVNNAAGEDIGIAQLKYINNGSIQNGSGNAPYDPFDDNAPPPEEEPPANAAPTDIALSAATVSEDAAIGTVIGTLSATDADVGETFSYTLTDSAGGLFSITGANLLVAGALDYETATSHTITVRVTDGASNTFDKAFTITVTDIDETPAGDYEAEAEALFAAMATEPTNERKNLYNDLIVSLKTSGVWAKLDALYIMAAHDDQAASLNLIDPGNNTITAIGTAPTFTSDRGFLTSTSGYLNTNFNPVTVAGNYTQNSALFAVWSLTTAGAAGSWAGWYDGTDGVSINGRNSSINRYEWRINQTSASTTSNNTSTNGRGLFVATRTSSTATFLYKDGTYIATSSPTSTALNSHDIYLGAVTAAGSVAIEFAACVIGSGYTNAAGEQTALYNALRAYMTGVGIT